MVTTANKTYTTLLQLSAYAQYLFPFGGFIFPIILWSIKKDESEFIDVNGRKSINFQLSLLVYTIILVVIAVPIFLYLFFKDLDFEANGEWIFNNDIHWTVENFDITKITSLASVTIVATVVFIAMKVAEFFLILYAAVKNSNGLDCNYPFTINFIKPPFKLPVAGEQV
jgi:uncharacterized Tic20 family protein